MPFQILFADYLLMAICLPFHCETHTTFAELFTG